MAWYYRVWISKIKLFLDHPFLLCLGNPYIKHALARERLYFMNDNKTLAKIIHKMCFSQEIYTRETQLVLINRIPWFSLSLRTKDEESCCILCLNEHDRHKSTYQIIILGRAESAERYGHKIQGIKAFPNMKWKWNAGNNRPTIKALRNEETNEVATPPQHRQSLSSTSCR